jgi:hypothetical protein
MNPWIPTLALIATIGLQSRIALAETPGARISDGSAIHLKDFDVSITPPAGWEIFENHRGKTLVAQPIVKAEPIRDYSKPLYTRNLTLAISHQPRPMDELSAQELRAKLEKDFGQAAGVSGFQVVEHRFIDHRAKADALLVYTAFQYNAIPMSQMHIVMSGAKNSVLLTYTDLADEFQKNEAAMNLAWSAMMSVDMIGQAPERYEGVIQAAAGLGVVLVAGGMLLLLRRRAAKRLYSDAEDRIYRDDGHESHTTSVGIEETSDDEEAYAAHQMRSDVWDLKTQMAQPERKVRRRTPRAASRAY